MGQGLPQSATLAFLVNHSLFNYLYDLSKSNGIEMSIYVDDIIFSSDREIPQWFINKLFGIMKKNGMKIKRQKVHNYKNTDTKKITGVYVNKNYTRVSNDKHYEFKVQYKYLKENILKIQSLDDYLSIYNLYLKFYGKYQHILMVEGKAHNCYSEFINEYDIFFPKGIRKNRKLEIYKRGNIKINSDNSKINRGYQLLINSKNNN